MAFEVFSLFAKLGLDSSEYDKGLGDAKSKFASLGDSLKNGLATAAKIGGAAVAAAAAGVAALTKSAVESYADYEQLVGGVETLFKESADVVQEYAANAFKTAGLSANEYMETVTSFSASLLQSLNGDTAKAAEVADMAITDMADNANKMGTAMESIQVAYQGFAKQNYTMLDNLKLGYGGTKEEMERLLADATKLSGIQYDISNLNDVYQAIHVIQEELGIAGTTAKEASETISGSLSAMKSAWANLVTGIADENANFDELINNFVESAATAAKNILPRIEQALQGIGQLIEELAPVIAEAIPELINSVLPSIVKAAVSVVQAIVETLGDEDTIDSITQAAIDIVIILADAIADNIDKVIDAIVKIVVTIAEALTDPDTLEKLVEAAIKIILAIGEGLIQAIPDLLKALAKVIENILTAIGKWEDELFQKGKEVVGAIGKGISEAFKQALQWGHDLIDNFVQGIKDRIQHVIDTVKGVADKIKQYLGFSEPEKGPLSNFHTYAPDMMRLFAQGIRDNAGVVTSAINDSFDFGARTVDVAANSTGTNQSYSFAPQQTNNQPIDITLQLDGMTLARLMYDYNKREGQLRGGALA